jgi:hypothetical protein
VANASVRAAIRSITESDAARQTGLYATFDLKNDFVNEWFAFSSRVEATRKKGALTGDVSMLLGDIDERVPFWTRLKPGLEVHDITLIREDVFFTDGLTLSADVGNPEAGKVGSWRCRTWTGLDVTDLKQWRITTKAETLKNKKVKNVYMLLGYVLGK